MAQKLSGENGIILWFVYTQSGKSGEKFGANSGLKSDWMAKLWQVWQSHPKPWFSEKLQRADQGKFFKNNPKSGPRLKSPDALWWKWDYPLICMLLKCKDWKWIWRKQRFQKSPNGQVKAIFAKSPKTRIFWKSAKGGPREIFQK